MSEDFANMTEEELQAYLRDLEENLKTESKFALDMKLRAEKIMKTCKIQFFVPSPKQMEFIEARTKFRGVFAGNRFGKSTIGVIEDCCQLLGYRPFFPEGDPRRYQGIPLNGVKGLCIAQDWEKVKEIFTNNEPGSDTVGKFFEWLPDGSVVKVEKNSQGIINVIHVHSRVHGRLRKSVIYFDTVKSFRQDPKGSESSDWDFIHVDEPIPQDMWKAVSRGLIDRGGSAWFLLTSLDEPWLYDWISEGAKDSPDLFTFITATMWDNPTLKQQDIADYLNTLTPEEREAREKGIPLQAGRLVYPFFSDAHILDEFPSDWVGSMPPATYDVAYAIDPHPQTPHAVLFAAIAPTHVIFYSELFVKATFSDRKDAEGNVIARGLASMVKDRIERCNVTYALCDPSAWIVDPETRRCWADALREEGLNVVKASKAKTNGIKEANDWLANGKGKKLYFHASLKQTIWEFRRYHYDKENKPVDKNDHLMECFYRLVVHDGFNYYGPPDMRPQGISFLHNHNPSNLSSQFAGRNYKI